MRIVIDATTLLLNSAGVKNYIYYWFKAMTEAGPLRADTIRPYPPLVRVSSDIDHRIPVVKTSAAIFLLKLVQLSNIHGNPLLDILLSGTDLFHCSQHTRRLPRGIKATATIFDFSCWTTPQYHTGANIAATKRYAAKILSRCDGLIAISAHARQDAIEIMKIPEDRIRVIYPGVTDGFFDVSHQAVAMVRSKYLLPECYVLFLGCIEPRKNVEGLIRAYSRLPESIRRDVPLILAGPLGWMSEDVLPLLISDYVRYLGYVPEVDLPALFRGASVFIYPSFYEGFGLPVAQAMAAGVPVITSDRSCLPEVVGDGGVTVNPDSTDALSAAIQQLLSKPDAARALGLRGQLRARAFQWPIAAAASLDWFHDIKGAV